MKKTAALGGIYQQVYLTTDPVTLTTCIWKLMDKRGQSIEKSYAALAKVYTQVYED